MNQLHMVIPIVLIVCVTYAFVYAIKAIVDARMRSLLTRAGTSDELIRTIVLGEEQQRRLASLRWGLILVGVAIGFGSIAAFGWDDITPGAIAVLAGATGLANLAFFAISARLQRNG
jgi:hypothetical protein